MGEKTLEAGNQKEEEGRKEGIKREMLPSTLYMIGCAVYFAGRPELVRL